MADENGSRPEGLTPEQRAELEAELADLRREPAGPEAVEAQAVDPNTVPALYQVQLPDGLLNIVEAPTGMQVLQVQSPRDGSPRALLLCSTPSGVQGYVLHAEACKSMGAELTRIGQASSSGLVLPVRRGIIR